MKRSLSQKASAINKRPKPQPQEPNIIAIVEKPVANPASQAKLDLYSEKRAELESVLQVIKQMSDELKKILDELNEAFEISSESDTYNRSIKQKLLSDSANLLLKKKLTNEDNTSINYIKSLCYKVESDKICKETEELSELSDDNIDLLNYFSHSLNQLTYKSDDTDVMLGETCLKKFKVYLSKNSTCDQLKILGVLENVKVSRRQMM
ncbi:hypothetical protein EDC94DRAFT_648836 [Helicostylum pulchrum]|nr:hypothetical protein EDC94DRAFT_648836 [Helicostylum pulchrum]